MAHCSCLRYRAHVFSTILTQPPIAPRCLLLGPSGSGKTTFLFRLKHGEYFSVKPTDGVNSTPTPLSSSSESNDHAVEELPVTRKTSLVLSDIGGSDRREVRLHFLHSVPILDLSILFFIDASAPLATLPSVLEDLVYHVTYARNRAGGTRYVGVVLNKQDLLSPAGDREKEYQGASLNDRATVVERIKEEVHKVMAQVMKVPLLDAREDTMRWEVLDGKKDGISAKTGVGVKDVFDTVARAVFGVEKTGLLGVVTGGLLETVTGGPPSGLG
jgi:hypothetical protein